MMISLLVRVRALGTTVTTTVVTLLPARLVAKAPSELRPVAQGLVPAALLVYS